ncbi:bifunctional hydroxymethylpyrimidine kinase/phosphomethylpyrimidine kinase [Methylomagnum ishizawai]|uniref:bifunctional hydroxymethylpyrimidine kinase/phosphomethylpyrimidine kinase n=1 Tax=Methylomagnum ishizawai TaxID=1760988 RepID=UPI001C321B59|nr:hydroxymethylpyrimidine/phosphomethylpyrimidine kinase [Methylomagnum ishizawai]BBL73071.1 hydroxymethylpyrimidine/phosphomethylpyrimidine kinase [Methylomagnum ishizawai]
MNHPPPPVVLNLSGHDPTGGAGIQADIETQCRLGCHPCTVITALTVQDTHNVLRVLPQAPEAFLEQAKLVLADLPVAAIKIGLLGSVDIAWAVAEVLELAGPGIPVVLDPILAAGGGQDLAGDGLIEAVRTRLLPHCTLTTPNTPEAQRLTGLDEAGAQARALLDLGCRNVLLTGGHEDGPELVNRWYSAQGITGYRWPRLPGTYHGSGCTLAAASAAGLALGLTMEAALREAQGFTWQALSRGFRPGGGQWLPWRGK